MYIEIIIIYDDKEAIIGTTGPIVQYLNAKYCSSLLRIIFRKQKATLVLYKRDAWL
jgi:hypothetical protein